jgi:hypothetical protein
MANEFSANPNKRVFYATQGVAVGDQGATAVIDSYTGPAAAPTSLSGKVGIVHGLQSIGVTTNFNLEQIFELGQLSLYENREDIPEIEVTFEKVLDGYQLLYHLGTVDATSPTLPGRANARADVRMVVGYDTEDNIQAGGNNSGVAELYCSGMYISSVSYSLATDGNFTESTTFVGNDKQWLTGNDAGGILVTGTDKGRINAAFATTVFGSDAPVGEGNSVLRRENVVIGGDGLVIEDTRFITVVPSFIEGATAGATGVSGPTSAVGTGMNTNCSFIPTDGTLYLSTFSTSVDLGRESINQLGKRVPYYRYVSFPVDVTTDIETTAVGGDNIDAAEEAQNLSNHSIQIVCDDSTIFQLGNKNKVTSVTYGGGDAGGGNATVSYSMTNSNDFVVLHSGDPIYTNTLASSGYFKNWFTS